MTEDQLAEVRRVLAIASQGAWHNATNLDQFGPAVAWRDFAHALDEALTKARKVQLCLEDCR